MNTQPFILIVDDNPTNVKVLFEVLETAGFRTLIARSGEDALETLTMVSPNLILLDVMMPGMSGFEVCQRIKADANIQNIPVIFMTALSDTTDKVTGLSVGAVDYITKPFQQEEVLARVKIHLQLHQQTQQLQFLAETLEQRVAEQTTQLVQHEKMAALGNLVAGVAHEINNPIGFLNGSINHARDYVRELLGHLELYRQHYPNAADSIQNHAEDINLGFLSEDLLKLLNSMEGATHRIKSISTSLCTFSRADTEHTVATNIHEGLDSTLLILKYRLKANQHRPAIEVITKYTNLPQIECFPGQLNQVFMNILANAIDMFDEVAQQSTFAELQAKPQMITIQTILTAQEAVEIRIRDNGKGMPEAVKERIFNHLFTTKSVGKGTGLGLAIARQIVVEKHAGTLEVHSTPSQGAEFVITLPVKATVAVKAF